MKTTFDTLRDYHVNDPSLMVRRHEMEHLAVTRLHETSNDITIASVDRNFLSMDLSGTARHLTRMEGCASDRPTRPGDVRRPVAWAGPTRSLPSGSDAAQFRSGPSTGNSGPRWRW